MAPFLLSSSAQTIHLNHDVHCRAKNPSVAGGISLGLMPPNSPEPPDPPVFGSVVVDSSRTLKGMTFATCLNDLNWTGTYRSVGFFVLSLKVQSQHLPQYEDLRISFTHRLTQYEANMHLVCFPLPQYEAPLPQFKARLPQHEVVGRNFLSRSVQYICRLVVLSDVSGLQLKKKGDEFKVANLGSLVPHWSIWMWWFLQIHTPLWLRFSSQFQGSPRWFITFVAKFFAALYAFVAAACSGSSSRSLSFDSRGFISPISTYDVSVLSCLNAMFAFICVFVTCSAFDAVVSLVILVVLLCLLNNFSIDGG